MSELQSTIVESRPGPLEGAIQPMGPLKKGDQAIVDVAQKISIGMCATRDIDYAIDLRCNDGPVVGFMSAVVDTPGSRIIDRIHILKNEVGAHGIEVVTTRSHHFNERVEINQIIGNVQEWKSNINSTGVEDKSRLAAQVAKFGAAKRIEQAARQLGKISS